MATSGAERGREGALAIPDQQTNKQTTSCSGGRVETAGRSRDGRCFTMNTVCTRNQPTHNHLFLKASMLSRLHFRAKYSRGHLCYRFCFDFEKMTAVSQLLVRTCDGGQEEMFRFGADPTQFYPFPAAVGRENTGFPTTAGLKCPFPDFFLDRPHCVHLLLGVIY